jgi:hypothetical protein
MQRCRLDFFYLICSGLGIPDYWHPYLEIQNDFQSGKIARYPLSMDIKAYYPGSRYGKHGNPGIVTAAEKDFNNGVQAVRVSLPCFTRGNWSRYSLTHRLGKPLLASPYYQRANGLLAQIIGLMTDDPGFSACGKRWLESSQSLPRSCGDVAPHWYGSLSLCTGFASA